MRKIVDVIHDIYYREIIGDSNSLEKIVFMQNDKFLDIFNRIPVFNVLNMQNISYQMKSDGIFFIRDKEVDLINGILPWNALAVYEESYSIKYKTEEVEMLRYPEVKQQKGRKEKVFVTEESAYLEVKDFSKLNPKFLLQNQGKNLFLDLRKNGGGNIVEMLKWLDLLMVGKLFCLSHKNQVLLVKSSQLSSIAFKSIVLLVDEQTASSAEFFAKTLQSARKCKIAGRTTYGKWIAHKIIQMDKYYIKIPQFIYETIQGEKGENFFGIQPDIYLKTDADIEQYLRYNQIYI